jgi:hypothetical protein
MTSSGLEPVTFQLVAQCPNHYATAFTPAPTGKQKLNIRLNTYYGGFLAGNPVCQEGSEGDGVMWTGLVWFRIGTDGQLL